MQSSRKLLPLLSLFLLRRSRSRMDLSSFVDLLRAYCSLVHSKIQPVARAIRKICMLRYGIGYLYVRLDISTFDFFLTNHLPIAQNVQRQDGNYKQYCNPYETGIDAAWCEYLNLLFSHNFSRRCTPSPSASDDSF
jgi:hypothetical protein